MYSYKAYGLVFHSELAIPELLPADGDAAPDVVIRLGAVPQELENAGTKRPVFQAALGEFLLRVKNVAGFYVKNGREITIAPAADIAACGSGVRLFLLGSVFGALLQQRGILVLHGAAVWIEGKGVLITGESTAGKSTLAAALNKKGHAILTDDVCAVALGDDRTPYMYPGFPNVKLWRDAAEMLNTDIDGLEPILQDWKKYRVGIRHYHSAAARLDEIYVLDAQDEPCVRIEAVAGFPKLNALIQNSYRYQFLAGQGLRPQHFRQCAAVAAKAKIFRVIRPKTGCPVGALAEAVERNVSGNGETDPSPAP